MRCGEGGVDPEGTVAIAEVVGVGVDAVDAVDAVAAGADVAVAAGHLGGRRRTVPHPGQVGRLAMWAGVAGIVVGLEIIQQLFS